MESQKQNKPVSLHYQLYVPYHEDHKLSPVILLHGTGALHSSWNIVRTQIGHKTKRKVYAVDLRNHGQSGWSEDNSLNDHKADLENFLLENSIKKCILIGHSLGGKIAMFFALKRPELVEMLITEEIKLSNPSPYELEGTLEILASAKKISKLPKDIDESKIRSFFSSIVAERFPEQSANFAFSNILKKNCDGSLEFLFNIDVIEKTFKDRTAFDIDFKECKKFTGPVLLLYAETSPIKVAEDKKIRDFFPNAEFNKFKTCTHILHVDRPEEFIKIVSSFINNYDSLLNE